MLLLIIRADKLAARVTYMLGLPTLERLANPGKVLQVAIICNYTFSWF
jgi:hypothetical protein